MSRTKKQIVFQVATDASPAMSTGETDKERMHLTPQEFGQQLAALAAETKDLVKMARKVGALKSGQHLRLSDGSQFGAKELNALVSRHNKTLKQLKKNYTARGTRKKRAARAGAARAGEGFAKGSFLRDPLVAFLRSANFGTTGGPAGGGESIGAVIAPLLDNGLLSRSILTVLFTIYEFANGLRFEDGGKKYFRAGPEMEKSLGPYLSALEAADRAKSDLEMTDAKGNLKPRFDRNRFVYNRLQSIVQPGLFSKADLDADRLAYLENDAVKATLRDSQAVVSQALKLWNP